jgi:hypothetical protein
MLLIETRALYTILENILNVLLAAYIYKDAISLGIKVTTSLAA